MKSGTPCSLSGLHPLASDTTQAFDFSISSQNRGAAAETYLTYDVLKMSSVDRDWAPPPPSPNPAAKVSLIRANLRVAAAHSQLSLPGIHVSAAEAPTFWRMHGAML